MDALLWLIIDGLTLVVGLIAAYLVVTLVWKMFGGRPWLGWFHKRIFIIDYSGRKFKSYIETVRDPWGVDPAKQIGYRYPQSKISSYEIKPDGTAGYGYTWAYRKWWQ